MGNRPQSTWVEMGVGDREWLGQIESFGTQSLFKLVFLVLALTFLALLSTSLPGLDRIGALLPVSVAVVIRTGVTVVILVLLFRIADEARIAIFDLSAGEEEFRTVVGEVGYWGVILLAVGVGYEGFRPAGYILFDYAGFTTFYPILFGLIALIPLAMLSVEVGLFARKTSDDGELAPLGSDEFRTDEQRVYHVLEECDGTVYQSQVAEATGWSHAKVSRLLSGMEESGTIVRFRVGRQKIVCLPGHEPGYVSVEG